jgi:hypothetical protein
MELPFQALLLIFHQQQVKMSNKKIIEQAQKQAEEFETQVKDLTLDRMNQAPVQETEAQTKLSTKEIDRSKEIYLKPVNSIGDGQKFNPEFESEWNFASEYVQFIAEHKELIGESIELWTHPFGGKGAQYWRVPTNKPVWGPRYLAEQIRRKCYHRLVMQETASPGNMIGNDGTAAYYGKIIADTTIPRLTAEPVSNKKSVFMGA